MKTLAMNDKMTSRERGGVRGREEPFLKWMEKQIDVAEYCCEHYFKEANYWKIDGSPVFSIYDVNLLISQFGSVEAATEALEV